jgi:hypothetical protein
MEEDKRDDLSHNAVKEISDTSKFCQFCGSSDYPGKWRWISEAAEVTAGTDREHFQGTCPEFTVVLR